MSFDVLAARNACRCTGCIFSKSVFCTRRRRSKSKSFMLSFDDRSGNGDADSNGDEDEDEDGVHDEDDYVRTTMGAREVLASWLGWFTVSQSNTIS